MAEYETTEAEQQIANNFKQLALGFKQLDDKSSDVVKQTMLKELTSIMQECKRQLKDFEREARMDGMPPKTLSEKKRNLVQELNAYIAQKKAITAQMQAKSNLMDSSMGGKNKTGVEFQKNKDLMKSGRKEIAETEAALERSRRQVEETIQIGAQAAASLVDQTKQMEGILDDLDDITFNMKKAQKVIAAITRGLITDKCVLCLFFFIVLAGVCATVGVILLPPASLAALLQPPPPPFIPGLVFPPPPAKFVPVSPGALPDAPADGMATATPVSADAAGPDGSDVIATATPTPARKLLFHGYVPDDAQIWG